MSKLKIFHYKIRLRQGRKGKKGSFTSQIVAILNKKKPGSQEIVHRMGYFLQGSGKFISIDNALLSYYLNKGYVINMSVKKLLQKKMLFLNVIKEDSRKKK